MSQYKLKAIDTHVVAAQREAEARAAYEAFRDAEMAKLTQVIPHIAPVPLVDSTEPGASKVEGQSPPAAGSTQFAEALSVLDEERAVPAGTESTDG